MMNQFKVSRDLVQKAFDPSNLYPFLQQSKVSSPGASGPSTNPFLAAAPAASSAPIVDLFDAPVQAPVMASSSSKASDDLLQLGNPFADMFGSTPAPVAAAPNPMANQMWMSNGSGAGEEHIQFLLRVP